MLTTTQAARYLHISSERIRQLIKAGKLPARRVGRSWLVDKRDVDLFQPGHPGRRRKAQGNSDGT